MQSRRNI